MTLTRMAAAIGIACGLVELGRVVAGLGIEADSLWLVEPLVVGLIQLAVSLGLGLRPSPRSHGAFLFVFAFASVWDGSKLLVAHRPVYLLPVAALVAGLLAWTAARRASPSAAVGGGR